MSENNLKYLIKKHKYGNIKEENIDKDVDDDNMKVPCDICGELVFIECDVEHNDYCQEIIRNGNIAIAKLALKLESIVIKNF